MGYKNGHIGLGSTSNHVGHIALVAWGIKNGVPLGISLKDCLADLNSLSLLNI